MSVAATGELLLPVAGGSLERFVPGEPVSFERPTGPPSSRVFYAAAHVVADPLADGDSVGAALDWEATLAYRRHLWSWGHGVAEAMDTAQRGMGLGWNEARELISRSAAEARACGGRLAAGAGTDQLPAGRPASLSRIRDAYLEQCAFVEGEGCRLIVMRAVRWPQPRGGPTTIARCWTPCSTGRASR